MSLVSTRSQKLQDESHTDEKEVKKSFTFIFWARLCGIESFFVEKNSTKYLRKVYPKTIHQNTRLSSLIRA